MEKSTLFSSFITSINLIAGEFGGDLRHMKLGQWDVFMETREKLTAVMLTNPSDDHAIRDKYTQSLTEISSKFLSVYEMDLKDWDGEVSKYQSFTNHMNYDELLEIDNSNVELCVSCIEIVGQAIDKMT
ncbi:MAG: hypothetical protein HeimC2_44140 [Candidatus Heimdallarchaeota archaeon LC_2]|nr:MAG: hypothetical protein HeimC2_44140 [Candidatus Heimdallarchaeota archaeon LC_2]